jgi:hypothetical protein
MITLFVLTIKSLAVYHKSRDQLAKYITWFGATFGICLIAFSVPSFFTLDPNTLRTSYLIGEFFFYMGMVTQAAIVWCLVLRRYFSVYYITTPIAVAGFGAWAYDISRAKLSLAHNFITYLLPTPTTWVIIIMMLTLFVPVGLYFIRAAHKQVGLKAIMTSYMLGTMYAGIGLSTSSQELFTRQIISPSSAIVNIVISALLLFALVMPWQLGFRMPVRTENTLRLNNH